MVSMGLNSYFNSSASEIDTKKMFTTRFYLPEALSMLN